ncbi:MAG TPA: beta-ketoacyl-ACP synthase III [Mycobacteriales bacterium]|jgi:3-oxoacyl-[acyl-carrier-protein] synthase-3|nr:beta-ketoacyl-ACP synthase III [Mycobacteriales bacterium]
MNGPAAVRHSRIIGMAEQRPELLMTNHELPPNLDTSDEWIQQRTGIVSRRIAGPDETVVSMSSDAARKAVADAGVDPAQVGLVILATCSMPQPIPGGAAQVATALGATRAGAFDLNAACAGFCYALSVASDAVRLGSVEYAVAIGAEKISHWLDWNDRSSAILFGDGAGAVVVGPSDEPGISPVVYGSDGSAAGLIDMTPDDRLRLDGPAVFRWATTSLAPVALSVCEAAGVKPDELDALVLHQANLRIINSLARQIGASNAVIATDVVDAGNTSAASVPLALARLRREGAITTGDLALTLSFGSGLTWAGSVVSVP